MGAGDLSITSSGCLGDREAWGAAPVGRPRAPPKAGSGPHPSPCSAAWEKGEPERRGRSAPGRAQEPPPRVRALSRPGSPLPAAARWPCSLPTGRSHSTLPPPSAEVGWASGSLTCLLPPTFHCFAASADRSELGCADVLWP